MHRGDGPFERWVAIATCAEAHVEVDLLVDTYACARGNHLPSAVVFTPQ